MALKYNLAYSDYLGQTFIAEIYQDGFVGAATAFKSDHDIARIRWNGNGHLFDRMKSSECELTLISESDFQYGEFFTASLGNYYMTLKRTESVIWSGTFPPQTMSEAYAAPPYKTKLRFSDGLSDLKFVRYDNAGVVYESFDTLLSILQKCFAKIDSTWAASDKRNLVEIINVFENSMPAKTNTDGLLNQTYLDQRIFIYQDDDGTDKGMFCYDVVESIVTALGCRVYLQDNKWWVVGVKEMAKTAPRFLEYNTAGALTDSGTKTIRKNITNLPGALTHNRDATLEIQRIVNKLTYKYIYFFERMSANNSLIRNPHFSNQNGAPGMDYWTDNLTGGDAEAVYLSRNLAQLPIAQTINLLYGRVITFLKTYYNALLKPIETPATGARIPREVLAASQITDSALPSDLVINTNSYLRPIENIGILGTLSNLPHDTGDNFIIKMSFIFNKYCTPQAFSSYLTPNSQETAIMAGFNEAFHLRLFLSVQLGSFWLTGNVDENNLSWAIISDSYVTIDVYLPDLAKGYLFIPMDIDIECPVFPSNDVNDLDVKFYCPITQHLTVNSSMFPGSSPPFSDLSTLYLEDLIITNFQIVYADTGNQENTIIEHLSLSDTNDVREIEEVFEVRHGDGPATICPGSFRLAAPAYSITSQWHERGAVDLYNAKDIFLFRPAKEYLSQNRQDIAAILTATTTGGYIDFYKSLMEPSAELFAIDSMEYNTRTGEYRVTIIELVSYTRVWTDISPANYAPVGKNIFKPHPLTRTDLIPVKLREITEVDSKIIRPGRTATVQKITPPQLTNYPDSPKNKLAGQWSWQDKIPLMAGITSTYDYSQNGLHATSVTDVDTMPSDIGTCGSFNGVTSTITCPDLPAVNGVAEITVTAKFFKNSNKDQQIIGRTNSFRLRCALAGQMIFEVHIAGAWRTLNGVAAVSVMEWHTVTAVYNGANYYIYIDGILDNSSGRSGALTTTTNNVFIGSRIGTSRFFEGFIEMTHVYAVGVSPTEVGGISTTPSGINIYSEGHVFDEGDLVSNNQFETEQAKMVVTQVTDANNFRVIPADTRRTCLGQPIDRVGNVFNKSRQSSANFLVRDSALYEPELNFFEDVESHDVYDTVSKKKIELSRRGIMAPQTKGMLVGYDLVWVDGTHVKIGYQASLDGLISACRDSTNNYTIELTDYLTLDLMSAGANGRDYGGLPANDMHQVFIVADSNRILPTCGIISQTSAPIISGDIGDIWRLVGYVSVDLNGLIRRFYQTPIGYSNTQRRIFYDVEDSDCKILTTGTNMAWASIPLATFIPTLPSYSSFLGHFHCGVLVTSATPYNYVYFKPNFGPGSPGGSPTTIPIVKFGTNALGMGFQIYSAHEFDLPCDNNFIAYMLTYPLGMDEVDVWITGFTYDINSNF